jgi:DNA ligase-1
MKYSKIVEMYERLEATTKKLEKADILAKFFRVCDDKTLSIAAMLSTGRVFPKGQEELGIAKELMKRIIIRATGCTAQELEKKFKQLGDLGLVAEYFAEGKKQRTLKNKELTIEKVYENLRKLPEITGTGSQEKKIGLVTELLANANGKEAKYIVRTVLGDMRIGVAHGLVRDALAKAFNRDAKNVERAFNVVGDFGKVALLAKKGKLDVDIVLGNPVRVMLAERAPDLKTALGKFKNPAVEVKYDGFRVAIHKDGDRVKIFSRRLDDVTHQFPEIVQWTKECVKSKTCILDGEALAVDKKTGTPRPFQQLSRRIQRKYNIEKMVKEIPIQVNLFDLIYVDDENYMKRPLRERWNKLKSIVKEKKGKFQLVEHLETKNLEKASEFYHKALEKGEEGVIVKNMDAHYQPGKRVGYWLKVKQILEPLDLVVVGAEWGEGKRARWLASLLLAARDPATGKFLPTGQMASGLTEKQLEDLTKKLKKLVVGEKGKEVKIKPEVVVEVGYEEIQKSPKYPTGYALRFPRLLRIREPEDKGPNDANTVKDIEKLFKQQKGRK